jgi:hypothetical protein
MDCLIVTFRAILNVNFCSEILRYETFCFEALPRWKGILKRILEKCNIRVWNGLKWLKIGPNRENDDTPSCYVIAGTFLTS